MIQRKVNVQVSSVVPKSETQREASQLIADMSGWRVSDVTVGYLSQEAVVGGTITIAVGFTNLTEFDVNLTFPNSQRITVSITDANGHQLYNSAPGTGPGGVETIKSTEGAYWTEKVILNSSTYKSGGKYLIHASMTCDLTCAASIILSIA